MWTGLLAGHWLLSLFGSMLRLKLALMSLATTHMGVLAQMLCSLNLLGCMLSLKLALLSLATAHVGVLAQMLWILLPVPCWHDVWQPCL